MTTEMNEDQIFYTIFCQLQVAIYNLVIGKDIKNQNKASWAVVAYYYSMLHSARTIIMIAEDDVPTGHKELIELLRNDYLFNWENIPGKDDVKIRKTLKEIFNHEWISNAIIDKIDDGDTIRLSAEGNSLLLKHNPDKKEVSLEINGRNKKPKFDVDDENNGLNIYKSIKNKSWKSENVKTFDRPKIIKKLSQKTGMNYNDLNDRLQIIGNNMYCSQKIRNMNSYEIYIMSHQTNHNRVTPILDDVLEILDAESQSSVITALNMYKEYICRLEPTQKNAYLSFLMNKNTPNDGFNYLYNVVFENQKIPHDLIKESKTWIDPFNEIEYDVDDVVKERLKEFKDNIVQSSFSLKTDRMEGLSKLVDKLSSVNFYYLIPEEIQ